MSRVCPSDYCSDTEILMEQAAEEEADLMRITFDYILLHFVEYFISNRLSDTQLNCLNCVFGSLIREYEISCIVQHGKDRGFLFNSVTDNKIAATSHGQRWVNSNIDIHPPFLAENIRFTLNQMFPEDAAVS